MKNLLIILFMAAGVMTGRLLAQDQTALHQEKMKAFASWVGHWQGESRMQMGPGEPHKAAMDEYVEMKLNGTILVVEGVGKVEAEGSERVVHHAFAVLSYDPSSQSYKFRTHLADGRSTDAWVNVLAENKFQWGFDTERGKLRYTIEINPSAETWNETGEFSADGSTWMKFFDMDLKKAG